MTTSASNPFALCADKMRTPCTSRSGFPTGTPFLLQADRKSTRLNSSHSQISYAVFCLKKKKKMHIVRFHDTRSVLTSVACISATPGVGKYYDCMIVARSSCHAGHHLACHHASLTPVVP